MSVSPPYERVLGTYPPGGPCPVGAAAPYWVEVGDQLSAASATRHIPELAALAFWLRQGHMQALATLAMTSPRPGLVRRPLGRVFHVAPANVDTLFAYSTCLAHLAGNASMVRLPSGGGAAADAVLAALQAAADRYPDFGAMNLFVRYPRGGEATAHFSDACDARVIWGGDETVRQIGAVPLPPAARELRFPDRFSAVVLRPGPWLEDAQVLADVADRLWSDIMAFDQMACSCPRLMVWIAPPGAADDEAVGRLQVALMAAAARRGNVPDPSRMMDRRVAADALAADGTVHTIAHAPDGRVSWVTLTEDASSTPLSAVASSRHTGGGLLYVGRVNTPEAAGRLLPRHVQTVVAQGLSLEDKAQLLKGSGDRPCRVVAPGLAHVFDPFWDGYDVFATLTRTIHLGGQPHA